jgi:hypothetical protein
LQPETEGRIITENIYSDEKNFSTIKQKEKKQTWFSLENGYGKRAQSACIPQGQRQG